MLNIKPLTLGLASLLSVLFSLPGKAQTVTWKLTDVNMIGNSVPQVLGAPVVTKDSGHKAIAFNGVNDGLVLPHIPIEGWQQFTIEVLVKPAGDGPTQPRFLHFQDADDNRGTMEMRLTADKQWYLDVFLKNGKAGDKGTTLIDPAFVHPTDSWYWIALVYDGKTMFSYVNGVKEKEGAANFKALGSAPVAIGMRLNKVNWFKGLISEVRFHPQALQANALQK